MPCINNCTDIDCGKGACYSSEESGYGCKCFKKYQNLENDLTRKCVITPCYNVKCGRGRCKPVLSEDHASNELTKASTGKRNKYKCECDPGFKNFHPTQKCEYDVDECENSNL